MMPRELAGIALYSDSISEIESSIENSMNTDDEYLFGECFHAVGHIARRFKKSSIHTQQLHKLYKERFMSSHIVKGALVDMNDDLEHFLK